MATSPSQAKEARRARELADGPFTCPSCSVTIARKSDFAYHLNIHTDKYKCTVCGKGNTRESTLADHMKAKHTGGGTPPQNQSQTKSQSPIQPQSQTQPPLQKQATSPNAVQTRPMRSPEGHFLCPQCPSKASREADLNMHMNIHTDKFKCSLCDKRHTRSSTLSEHMKMKHSAPHGSDDIPRSLARQAPSSPPLWERIQNLHQKEHEMVAKSKDDLPPIDLLQSAMDMADIPADPQKVRVL